MQGQLRPSRSECRQDIRYRYAWLPAESLGDIRYRSLVPNVLATFATMGFCNLNTIAEPARLELAYEI